jgi:PAS domain S-box-containing protein
MSLLGISLNRNRSRFSILLAVISVAVVSYATVFFFLEARLVALCMMVGVLVFVPVALFCEVRGYAIAARIFLLAEVINSIFAVHLGTRAPLNIELYYLTSMTLPFIVFEAGNKKAIWGAVSVSVLMWALQQWLSMPEFSTYWVPTEFPAKPFQNLNFLGTAVALMAFLNLHVRSSVRVQRELDLSNKQLNDAQRIARMGSWSYELETNEMTWSDQLKEIFKFDFSQSAPTFGLLVSSIHPHDRDSWILAVQDCIANGTPFSLRFRKLIGERKVWIEARVAASGGSMSEVLGLSGTFQDITDLVKNELELQRRQDLLEAILDNVPSIIFVRNYSADLGLQLMNRAGERFFGVKESDVIGKTIFEANPSLQSADFSEYDLLATEQREMLNIDVEEIMTSAGARQLHTYRIPTYDVNGAPQLLIGVFTDVTDELKAKADLETERLKTLHVSKMAALGELSAGIAHEINNPLAVLELVVGQVLRHVNDVNELQTKVDAMKRSCQRIAKIVRGLRKFSRSGDKPDLRCHKLQAIVEEALTLVDAKARGQKVTLEIDCPSSVEILCDELEIEQVVVNLLINAIDAIKNREEKWIRVTIEERPEDTVLRITDSGSGIPENISKKLFDPFFTTKTVGEGTGLGLSIARGILDEHRATIEIVQGVPNTCFEIRFTRAVVSKKIA